MESVTGGSCCFYESHVTRYVYIMGSHVEMGEVDVDIFLGVYRFTQSRTLLLCLSPKPHH